MYSKIEADYQSKPRNNERCGICRMFKMPHSCTLVQGFILTHGWCKYFEGWNDGSTLSKEE